MMMARRAEVWTITKNADGTYIANTDDVDGHALGRLTGPPLNYAMISF